MNDNRLAMFQRWTALVIVLLLFALVACNPSKRAAKRIQRDLDRFPELAQRDTIRDTIRILVPAEGFDSLLVVEVHDTIHIDSGRVRVVVVRGTTGGPCDTVRVPLYIKADCDPVTVDKPTETVCPPVPKCPECEGVADWWRTVAIVLGVLLAFTLWLLSRRR